jgi:hypothetical protein
MKIRSIDTLIQNGNLDKEGNIPYFDLTQVTWTRLDGDDSIFLMHFVDKYDEMRLDSISYKIYGNTDYIDYLMFLNDLVNPLNIKEGDLIFYTNVESANSLMVEPQRFEETRNKLLDLSKTKRIDKNRENYLQKINSNSLPPTVSTNNQAPVQFEDGRVIIGRGLFNG